MNKTLFAIWAIAGLTACTPKPITDDSVYTGKYTPAPLKARKVIADKFNWSCSGNRPFEPRCDEPPVCETCGPHIPPADSRPKGNNGLGNGDQPAPGGSMPNNKAENEVGNPGHASGKPQRSD